MGIERAFARIVWRNQETLALQMVNTKGQKFLIYADALVAIFDNPQSFVKVKKKDGYKKRENPSYYPGDVWGTVVTNTDTKTKTKTLIIYIGPAESAIEYNEETGELNNVVEIQEYTFPTLEISRFVSSMRSMRKQSYEFTQLMMNSEVCGNVKLK